ncbi:MAG: STAS domain-containing protein, partial [Motiliproteus sp.]|nr:STAS domain-containing protein [Motiliproteus sp.]
PPFVVILMLLVLSLTVFVDLITAVLVGVFLANIYTVKRLSDVQLQEARVVSADDEQLSAEERKIYASLSDEVLLFCLSGPVSFGAAKQIEKRLAASRVHDALLLDLSRVPYIDVSTAFAIEGMIRNARESRRQVYLIGLTPLVSEVLERMRVLQLLNQQHVVEDRLSALQAVKLSIKSPATD